MHAARCLLAMFSVTRCAVAPVCAHPWGGAQCSGCAVGHTMMDAACRPETVVRKDVARLSPDDRTALLQVVRESAELGTRLNQITQAAHQAAVADKVYAPFNVEPSTGRALRNIHASFWFFQWHRGHLLAVEQAARSERVAPSEWATPYWNITAPDAGQVATRLMASLGRQLSVGWSYKGPSERELIEGSPRLATLVGEASLRWLHSAPHEWFRASGAQPAGRTNADNPLFLPLHSYLDRLFDRWLLRHGSAAATRLEPPDGAVQCGVQCGAGGATQQLARLESGAGDCLPHLPLWGFTLRNASQLLSRMGVAYDTSDGTTSSHTPHPTAGSKLDKKKKRTKAAGGGGGAGAGHEASSSEAEQQEGQQHWLQPRAAQPHLAATTTTTTALLLGSDEWAAAVGAPGGGLRLSLLSRERRETLLLLPAACGSSGSAPLPAIAAGRLPAHLQRPVSHHGGWHCASPAAAAAAPSPGHDARHEQQQQQQQQQQRHSLLVPVRVGWSASVRTGTASLWMDSHAAAPLSLKAGEACATAGAALLCLALCANATIAAGGGGGGGGGSGGDAAHASLRHPVALALHAGGDGGAGCVGEVPQAKTLAVPLLSAFK